MNHTFRPHCPKCQSTNVEVTLDRAAGWSGVKQPHFHCCRCGKVLFAEAVIQEMERQQTEWQKVHPFPSAPVRTEPSPQVLVVQRQQGEREKTIAQARFLLGRARVQVQGLPASAEDQQFEGMQRLARLEIAGIEYHIERLPKLLGAALQKEFQDIERRAKQASTYVERAMNLAGGLRIPIERVVVPFPKQPEPPPEDPAAVPEPPKPAEPAPEPSKPEAPAVPIDPAAEPPPKPLEPFPTEDPEDEHTPPTDRHPTIPGKIAVPCGYATCGVVAYKHPYEIKRNKSGRFFCTPDHHKRWFVESGGPSKIRKAVRTADLPQ